MKYSLKYYSFSKFKNLILLIANFVIFFASHAASIPCEKDPDFQKNTSEIIANKNYPVETYTVETSDNYVLTIFRIPNGNGYKGDKTKKPVMLLMHCLFCSSSVWVANFPNQSLGYLAYDQGYDVWMGNFRGNVFSKTNTKIKNTNPLFWLFSWDEMALIDLPTTVDFVLDKTSQSEIYYVGYSLGTTIGLAFLANKTEYQQKVKKVALLAPVGTVYYSTYPLFTFSSIKDLLFFVSPLTSGVFGEVFPDSKAYDAFLKLYCVVYHNEICEEYSDRIFNNSRKCVYESLAPVGTSANVITHYLQERQSQVFQMYDYGFILNYVKYGQSYPFQYNVGLIKIPIGLYSSEVDDLADPKDLDFLRKNLGTKPAEDFVIKDKDFVHTAFALGINSSYIYSRIFELFSSG